MSIDSISARERTPPGPRLSSTRSPAGDTLPACAYSGAGVVTSIPILSRAGREAANRYCHSYYLRPENASLAAAAMAPHPGVT
jgi:hypothetical protein